VSEDVWSADDTTPDAIEAALRELLRERHAADSSLAPARVLNLIVIIDREFKAEVKERLERAGQYHASRTVLCAVEPDRTEMDAVATISYEDPHDGLSVVRETVEIDIGPEHLRALRTIVDPVLISEIPTVCWSPGGHAEIVRELLGVVDVILLDSDDAVDPREAFQRAELVREHAYVVDLAWLRTTPWRERLAASLGQRPQALDSLLSIEIRYRDGSTACALLLAGWLASRLGWERRPLTPGHSEIGLHGAERSGEGQVAVTLRRSDQESPGLAGVTVSAEHGVSLSLQRGVGGLDATEHLADGRHQEWKILGASRGEGGILGEGIRQALLRDPIYGPALVAGRELCPLGREAIPAVAGTPPDATPLHSSTRSER
jgi:glucose-6-phosphate dehydrogenase assembly protein OpcA